LLIPLTAVRSYRVDDLPSFLARTVPLPHFLAAELAALVEGKNPDTCTPATWTNMPTASTTRPRTPVRPDSGQRMAQTRKKTARKTHDRAVYLR
jgi:hypothetical protein